MQTLVGNDFIHIALLDWRESKIWRKMLSRKGYSFYKPNDNKRRSKTWHLNEER